MEGAVDMEDNFNRLIYLASLLLLIEDYKRKSLIHVKKQFSS